MILTGRNLNQYLGLVAGNVVVLDALFLIAATALLCLAGCASQGAQLPAKPLSGYIRLSQEQVGYMGGTLQKEGEVGFHRPTYIAGGRLNVGTGVLDYQGSEYAFGVRGLGAEGIDVANIRGEGRGLRLRTLTGFFGNLCSGASAHHRRSVVEECKRGDNASCIEAKRDLDPGRRRRRG